MSEKKSLGKIQRAYFGFGGYQDCQVGLWILFSTSTGYVWAGYEGGWNSPPTAHAKWTIESQTQQYGEMVRRICDLLKDAKVSKVEELIGKPVEVTFEGFCFKDFRVLTEVL